MFYHLIFFFKISIVANENIVLRRSKSIHDLLANKYNNNNNNSNSNISSNQSAANGKYNALQQFLKHQIHTDACIQTMGLDDPENFSLRHINGKLKITKPANLQSIYGSSQNPMLQHQQQQQRNIYKSSDNINKFPFNKSSGLYGMHNQHGQNNYGQHAQQQHQPINTLVDIFIDDYPESVKNNSFTIFNNNSNAMRHQNVPPPPFIQQQTPPQILKNAPLPLLDFSTSSIASSCLNQSSSMLEKQQRQFRPSNFLLKNITSQLNSSSSSSITQNDQSTLMFKQQLQQNQSGLIVKTQNIDPSVFALSSHPNSGSSSSSSSKSRLRASPKHEVTTRRFYQPKQLVPPSPASRTTVTPVEVTKKNSSDLQPVQMVQTMPRKSSFSSTTYSTHLSLANDEEIVTFSAATATAATAAVHELVSSSSADSTSSSSSTHENDLDIAISNNYQQPSAKPRNSGHYGANLENESVQQPIIIAKEEFEDENEGITLTKVAIVSVPTDDSTTPTARPRSAYEKMELEFSSYECESNIKPKPRVNGAVAAVKFESVHFKTIADVIDESNPKPKPRNSENFPAEQIFDASNYEAEDDNDGEEEDRSYKSSSSHSEISKSSSNSSAQPANTDSLRDDYSKEFKPPNVATVQQRKQQIKELQSSDQQQQALATDSGCSNSNHSLASSSSSNNSTINMNDVHFEVNSTSNLSKVYQKNTTPITARAARSAVVGSNNYAVIVDGDSSQKTTDHQIVDQQLIVSSSVNTFTSSRTNSSSSSTSSTSLPSKTKRLTKAITSELLSSASSSTCSGSRSPSKTSSSQSSFVNHMKSIFEQSSTSPTHTTTSNILLSPLHQVNLARSPLKKFNIDSSSNSGSKDLPSHQQSKITTKTSSEPPKMVSEYQNVPNNYDQTSVHGGRETSFGATNTNTLKPASKLPPPPSYAPPPPPFQVPFQPPPVPVSQPPSLLTAPTCNDNLVSKILATSSPPVHQQLQQQQQQPKNITSIQSQQNSKFSSNLPPKPLTFTLTAQTTTTTLTASISSSCATSANNNNGSICSSQANTNRPNNRFMSSVSNNSFGNNTTNLAKPTANNNSSEFRLISTSSGTANNGMYSERSAGSRSNGGGSQLNLHHNPHSSQSSQCVISHLSDVVDEVKLEYSGERRIFVPGYMTSADVLRNILLNKADDLRCVNTVVQQQKKSDDGLSLKEKLLRKQKQLQQQLIQAPQSSSDDRFFHDPTLQFNGRTATYNGSGGGDSISCYYSSASRTDFNTIDSMEPIEPIRIEDGDDEELAKKFAAGNRTRTRTLSGVITLPATQVVDIDLDFGATTCSAKPPQPPPQAAQINKPSTIISSPIHLINSSKNSSPVHPSSQNYPLPPTLLLTPPPLPTLASKYIPASSPTRPDIIRLPGCDNNSAVYSTPKILPKQQQSPKNNVNNFCQQKKDYGSPMTPQKQQQHQPVVNKQQNDTSHQSSSNLHPLSQQLAENQYASALASKTGAESLPTQPSLPITGSEPFRLSVRQNSARNNSSRRSFENNGSRAITGSFDPNDFDSFDESDGEKNNKNGGDDDENEVDDLILAGNVNNQSINNQRLADDEVEAAEDEEVFHIPLESIEKIKAEQKTQQKLSPKQQQQQQHQLPIVQIESLDKILQEAMEREKIEPEQQQQPISNVIHFDPEDFDSFDEDDNNNLNNGAGKISEEMNESYARTYSYKRRQIQLKLEFQQPEAVIKITKPVETSSHTSMPPIQPKPLPSQLATVIKKEQQKVAAEAGGSGSSSSGNNSSPEKTGPNFFRNAFDRLSMSARAKSRSSSVPMRTVLNKAIAQPELTDIDIEIDKTRPITPPQRQAQERSRCGNESNVAAVNVNRTEKAKTLQATSSSGSGGFIANMKTLQLMNKIQSDFEAKQARKKLRKQQQQKMMAEAAKAAAAANPAMTPKTERKLLNSIMNTLFSPTHSSSQPSGDDAVGSSHAHFDKTDKKRLSLKKLKMKDKTKKTQNECGNGVSSKSTTSQSQTSIGGAGELSTFYQSDTDYETGSLHSSVRPMKASKSLSLINGSNYDEQVSMHSSVSNGAMPSMARYGKIKNEKKVTEAKKGDNNNKENLMKQLKAEVRLSFFYC